MNFLGMGPLELVVICALALIFFGPDKLPDLARQIGRAVREVRKLSSEVTDEIQKTIEPERRPAVPPPAQSLSRPAADPPPAPRPVSQKERNVEPPY
jgi:Tat protein translocase TatB subunit